MQSIKFKTVVSVLAAALIPICVSGCVQTYGRYHSPSEISQIKKFKSTKQDVIAILGNPDSTSVDNTGRAVFNYVYIKRTPALVAYGDSPVVGNSGDTYQTTIVIFNGEGIVTNVQSTTNSHVLRGKFGSDGVGRGTEVWAPAKLEGLPQ